MQEDRQRWNKRFSDKPMRAPGVPGFLAEQFVGLEPSRVLDVASGDGAASLFLAERGFDVTAADISEVALQRLQRFAEPRVVHTLCVDFDEYDWSAHAGRYDHIVMAHFKPSLELLDSLALVAAPGSRLWLSTFNLQHHEVNGFSRRFCLLPDEFVSLPRWSCVLHQSVERGGDFMDDYCFEVR
ncbi:methyltransferase domain-containing protein [Pseudomaricurvus alkylphenolicus]|uniref:class I SAM-dependent methyltransferase n=1 Tax=Pseudomaricurvus alkylphenolicus TaxID=1306991 RepID=UPI0014202B2E|nr:methyltransferase domain-containing protein [Pseudomaricurvus alkylphenolicus]NIB40222.1 methyltransferase domain-containing protein [Pseudomaricurvus alkylphenolicus]